jgi:hypothetical protein
MAGQHRLRKIEYMPGRPAPRRRKCRLNRTPEKPTSAGSRVIQSPGRPVVCTSPGLKGKPGWLMSTTEMPNSREMVTMLQMRTSTYRPPEPNGCFMSSPNPIALYYGRAAGTVHCILPYFMDPWNIRPLITCKDSRDELPLRLSGFCSGRGRPFVRALPQVLIGSDLSTETPAPRLRPHFTHHERAPFGRPRNTGLKPEAPIRLWYCSLWHESSRPLHWQCGEKVSSTAKRN